PEVEDHADEDDEEWRLDREVPEGVLVGVEQRDPVRLDERPNQPDERGQRAQRRDRCVPPRVPGPGPCTLADELSVHHSSSGTIVRAEVSRATGKCLRGPRWTGTAERTTCRRRRGQRPARVTSRRRR